MDSIHEPVKHTNSNMKIDVHLGHYEHNLTESIAVSIVKLFYLFVVCPRDIITLANIFASTCTIR